MGDLRGAAFLRAAGSSNDHDLGLFEIGSAAAPSSAGRTSVGLYHLAWEVDTLAELKRVRAALQRTGRSVARAITGTTKSLYGRDPDGLEFEVVWIIPQTCCDDRALSARARISARPRPRDRALRRETRAAV
jgi:catechol-2,3-dioxygenase